MVRLDEKSGASTLAVSLTCMNGSDDEKKFQWLKVWLTGHAQKAFRLPMPARSFSSFLWCSKYGDKITIWDWEQEDTISWVPGMPEKGKRRMGWLLLKTCSPWPTIPTCTCTLTCSRRPASLSVNTYLEQIRPSQVAFGGKQKRPNTTDKAVRANPEMES